MQQYQQVVDDLILIKRLGKGNYGEVYLTKRKDRPEYYATKKMERAICERPENITRLMYEIEIIKSINHPNIVKFCGLKKTINNWYLVTEYVNGGSLQDNLKQYMARFQRPFTEVIVQHLMKQIVSALNYLHFNKIIHRDLKLDNILVNFPSANDKNSLNMMNATVKIIDFGFATKLNKPLTYTALGTPTNMDPVILENIKTGIPNAGYNEKVDIWSLGTICYEMLVGHIPFTGKSFDELFQRVKQGKYSLPITLSKEVVSFINGMLQQDPNQRLTAQQLLYHDFLVKHPSQFQSMNVRDIPGSIGPGGVINMNANKQPQPQPQVNNNFYQLWGFFGQPQVYLPGIQGQPQVQPQMELPVQTVQGVQQVQQFAFVDAQPQQQQYYVNPVNVYQQQGW